MWVEADRDRSPDLPKTYNVSAYPTLLAINAKRERIHRFEGYKKPADLEVELEEALRRWDLFKKGEEWDAPTSRPERICGEGEVSTFRAPSEENPDGIAFAGEDLWAAQDGTLFRLDPSSGEVRKSFPIPKSVTDLCSDGRLLYAIEYAWTQGGPIHVLDPETGKALRSIRSFPEDSKRGMAAYGVAWRDGKLWALHGPEGTIHEVDPETGATGATIRAKEKWLVGLEFDGRHFVAGTKTHLLFLDPASGEVARKVPVNYPLRSIAFRAGAYWLMEQPVLGFDRNHARVRVWPKETRIHRLALPKSR